LKPPNAQISSMEQKSVAGSEVVFAQAIGSVRGMDSMVFMQGGHRAPRVISSICAGPSMGFTKGLKAKGEPVTW
jgi:hypothetical protein